MKRSLILILFVLPTYVSAFSDGDLERLITTGNCPGCDLRKAKLVGENLIGADLSYSDLGNANLTGVNLTEANLTGANLVRVSLVNAKLPKAILAEAYLYGLEQVENGKCDGFYIGLNVGECAGQSVFWPHVHYIPRKKGDQEPGAKVIRTVYPNDAYNPKNKDPEEEGIRRGRETAEYLKS